MKNAYAVVLLSLVVFAAGCTQTTVVKQTNVLYEKWNADFTTTDGVLIKGDLYLPHTSQEKYPLVILVHQLNGDRRQWDNFIPALTERNYSVLAYDIRGLGESTRMADGKLLEETDSYFDDMLLDVRSAIDFASKEKRVDSSRIAVIGASIGGYIAYSSTTLSEVRTAVAMSPVADRFIDITLSGLAPRSVFFMTDENEADSTNLLALKAQDPKQVIVYVGTAHGVELLGREAAVNNVFSWLSKNL